MKRGRLTPNLVLSTPPKLSLEMNGSQGASSQRRLRQFRELRQFHELPLFDASAPFLVRPGTASENAVPSCAQTWSRFRRERSFPELSTWFCFCIHFITQTYETLRSRGDPRGRHFTGPFSLPTPNSLSPLGCLTYLVNCVLRGGM